MNNQTSDQGWQQLQVHIGSYLSHALTSDVQSIEYKPRFIALLSEMTSERQQNELQETSR